MTGSMKKLIRNFSPPSWTIEVSNGLVTSTDTGSRKDGSDERIVSPTLDEPAVVKGIAQMASIPPIKMQAVLKDTGTPATFSFYRTCHVPDLVLKLSVDQMELLNVTLLVADDETA